MKWWDILVIIMALLMIVSLGLYYYFPPEDFYYREFKNSEFSVENSSSELQFYPNMRFASREISYSINGECNLAKTLDIKEAFEIIENETVLNFYESSQSQIDVYCEEKNRVSDGLFIAGEGGPTEIVDLDDYSLILAGEILLIRNSNCEKPNIGIHEIFHVLGFNHSENPKNIMYPVSRCSQEIGNEVISKIAEVYSKPTLMDLEVVDFQAEKKGIRLNFNVSIKNYGFKNSGESVVQVYADDKFLQDWKVSDLKPGSGLTLSIENVAITKLNVEKIKIKVINDNEELSKENNELTLGKIE